jgi:hypothetical protein
LCSGFIASFTKARPPEKSLVQFGPVLRYHSRQGDFSGMNEKQKIGLPDRKKAKILPVFYIGNIQNPKYHLYVVYRNWILFPIIYRGDRTMVKIRKNKPAISADVKPFRTVRRLNINRTYTPLKIGVIAGYILLGMISASSSMFGILVGALLRLAGY